MAKTMYEVRTASGFPVLWGRRFRADDFAAARARCEKVWGGGQIVDLTAHGIGDQVVYTSKRYKRRFPRGGGEPAVPTEHLQPNRDMWTDTNRPDYVSW